MERSSKIYIYLRTARHFRRLYCKRKWMREMHTQGTWTSQNPQSSKYKLPLLLYYLYITSFSQISPLSLHFVPAGLPIPYSPSLLLTFIFSFLYKITLLLVYLPYIPISFLPFSLSACLPACLLTCLLCCLSFCKRTCLPANLIPFLPVCLLTESSHKFYLSEPIY